MALMTPPYSMADWTEADPYQRGQIEAAWEINEQSYQSRRLAAMDKQRRDTSRPKREEGA